MSKNYLPDIKVIRKPFALVKRWVLIVVIVASIVGTFMLADICSGALTLSTLGLNIVSTDRVNVEKYTLYGVSMGTFDTRQDAEKVALGLQVQGAAGYIWTSNNKYVILGSIFSSIDDANKVISNLQESKYTSSVFEIKYSKLSLVIKGMSGDDKRLIEEIFSHSKKIYSEIYSYSINYDSSVSSNLAISSSLNTLKGETKVYISKLQEMSSRIECEYLSLIKDTYITLDAMLDSAVYRTLTDSGVNYYLKYLMCEVVDNTHKLNVSLLKSK